jgi:hypothetical protein
MKMRWCTSGRRRGPVRGGIRAVYSPHALDEKTAKKIPKAMIGRTLTLSAAVLDRL